MAKWFDIKASKKREDDKKNPYSAIDLYIYDEIGGYGVQANDFVGALNQYRDADEINVRINSGGGSVIAGSVIYNALKRHKGKVITHVDGLSASMATVIAMAGDEVRMAQNGLFMIHNPWTQSQGEANDLRKEADLLDKIKETLLNAYSRSNLSEAQLSELMDAETWFTAKEAMEAGFIDYIDNASEKVAKVKDFNSIKGYNIPEEKKALLESAKDSIEDIKDAETYNDYPQSATNNAKKAIKYKEENGSDCGTTVGWTRARQLASREKISRDTIARMASFKRHQQHKDVPYSDGCGGLMWDCWGGTSGIEWAISKLEQIDNSNKIMEDIKDESTVEEVEASVEIEAVETTVEVEASIETEISAENNVVLEPIASEVQEEAEEVEAEDSVTALADMKDNYEASMALVADFKAKVELLETEIEKKEAQFELDVKALEEKFELDLAEAKSVKSDEISQASAEVLASIGVEATTEVTEEEAPKAETSEDFWAEYKSVDLHKKNSWYAQNKHRIGK